MKFTFALFLVLAFVGCASDTPQVRNEPEWTRGATRIVDNGYIVYVGHGEASTTDSASLKAEGQALEDLANECSLIPKGTRIEDRFSEKIKTGSGAWVKVALEMQDCETAAKTSTPEEVRKLANIPFTEQLKRYQDFNETGMIADSKDGVEITPPAEVAPLPTSGSYSNQTQFYMTRQYVAYEKQIVVLAPPTTYAPASPQAQSFQTAMTTANTQTQGMVQKDPGLKTNPTPWSHLPDRPSISRPQSLRPTAAQLQNHEMNHPNSGQRPQQQGKQKARGRGRRHRN